MSNGNVPWWLGGLVGGALGYLGAEMLSGRGHGARANPAVSVPGSRVRMRLVGADEVFTAPKGMTEMRAVRWLARLYYPTADRRIRKLRDGVYECSNGRRGFNRRGTIITVIRDPKSNPSKVRFHGGPSGRGHHAYVAYHRPTAMRMGVVSKHGAYWYVTTGSRIDISHALGPFKTRSDAGVALLEKFEHERFGT